MVTRATLRSWVQAYIYHILYFPLKCFIEMVTTMVRNYIIGNLIVRGVTAAKVLM